MLEIVRWHTIRGSALSISETDAAEGSRWCRNQPRRRRVCVLHSRLMHPELPCALKLVSNASGLEQKASPRTRTPRFSAARVPMTYAGLGRALCRPAFRSRPSSSAPSSRRTVKPVALGTRHQPPEPRNESTTPAHTPRTAWGRCRRRLRESKTCTWSRRYSAMAHSAAAGVSPGTFSQTPQQNTATVAHHLADECRALTVGGQCCCCLYSADP